MALLIVPTIIAQSQSELESMIERLRNKVENVMLDIMDGVFVPNRSLDFEFTPPEGFLYEAHLMVVNPLERLQSTAKMFETAILHVETLSDIKKAIDFVRRLGLKVTLAINPETDVSVIEPFLSEIDGVLVMTVNPGKYGGKFIPETLEKVSSIRTKNPDITIEVDGGMNPKNSRAAKQAGATIIASGSFIFTNENIECAIKDLSK